MERELVKKLSDAGVSAEVILKLFLGDDPEEKPEKSEEKPEEKPEKPEKPEQSDNPEKDDPVLKAIHELTGAIYASNIMRDGTASAGTETAEDILAKVLKGDEN